MAYTTGTIAHTLLQLNKSLFLPSFQRDYKWKEDQVLDLIDSVLLDYPVSTFLLWQVDASDVTSGISDFVADFDAKQPQMPANFFSGPVKLVLDGQQRLTSLNIAFQGSYQSAKLRAGGQRQVWIDLLHEPQIIQLDCDDEDDRNDKDWIGKRSYALQFSAGRPHGDDGTLWIALPRMMELETSQSLSAFEAHLLSTIPHATLKEVAIVKQNLARLHQALWCDHALAWHVEQNSNSRHAIAMFLRANEGGTKLKRADMAFSMLAAAWQNCSAKTFFAKLEQELRTLDRFQNTLTRDPLMKAVFTLYNLGAAYDVTKLTVGILRQMEDGREEFATTMRETYRRLNILGLDHRSLSAANAVIPVAYYVHQLRRDFPQDWSEIFARNASAIQRFLLGGLVHKIYGTRADNIIDLIIGVLRISLHEGPDFPFELLCKEMRSGARNYEVRVQPYERESILDSDAFEKRRFATLALCYPVQPWGIDGWQAVSILEEAQLRSLGMQEAHIKSLKPKLQGFANHMLLTNEEYLWFNDQPKGSWLDLASQTFKQRHALTDWHARPKLEDIASWLEHREAQLYDRMM